MSKDLDYRAEYWPIIKYKLNKMDSITDLVCGALFIASLNVHKITFTEPSRIMRYVKCLTVNHIPKYSLHDSLLTVTWFMFLGLPSRRFRSKQFTPKNWPI